MRRVVLTSPAPLQRLKLAIALIERAAGGRATFASALDITIEGQELTIVGPSAISATPIGDPVVGVHWTCESLIAPCLFILHRQYLTTIDGQIISSSSPPAPITVVPGATLPVRGRLTVA